MQNQTESKFDSLTPEQLNHLIKHSLTLTDLTAALTETLDENPAPAAFDPEFGAHVDLHALLQQCALVQHCNSNLAIDSLDHRSANTLRQTLVLIEKSRARQERNRLKEAGHTIRETALQPERDEARKFLESELSGGERSAKEIFQTARSIGIASATLKRAKASMNITSTLRHNPDRSRCWMWSIPTPTSTSSAPSDSAMADSPTSSPDSADSSMPSSSSEFLDAPSSTLVPPVSTGGDDATTTPADKCTLYSQTASPVSELLPATTFGAAPTSFSPRSSPSAQHFVLRGSGDQPKA